ncbi:putative defense protein Hdd11 [Diorhabda carinulata]|uniref:putative defense protein Hdd11 n=1 Tax=Diorhabda sublineata TaxID=1163346 RepID=UPI0024E13C7F|nr:putative defense protein Hdd11 [Diorhabda sublineata]XP_057671502.1 putative defense protein Hdd11 [Diorhabda carinulata]
MFKLLVLFSMIYCCRAYSGGAPATVCGDMIPQHPVDPQSSPFPYKIAVSKDQVQPGQTIEISVNGGSFKGLLLQVRNGDKAVGEFVIPADDRYFKPLTCHGNKNSAVTHKNSADKNSKTLVWKAPNAPGKYRIHVTVAKDGGVFWANVPSKFITVN